MANKQKYYVVWNGRKKGIFLSWEECKQSIDKFTNASYKSFESREEAEIAFKKAYKPVSTTKKNPQAEQTNANTPEIIRESLAVDAACSGNPGNMEYRGVYVKTGQEIFKMGPFPDGTNNIGEFLAIVHGLAILKQKGLNIPIYSDSKIAMGWVQKKCCNTKLEKTARNEKLFELIKRAELWLMGNSYTTRIFKWQTEKWGEIPADFGRK